MGAKRDVPEWSVEFRVFCIRKGLSTQEVADITGISYGMIRNYLNGAKRPRFNVCKRIQETLGFDMLEALYLYDRKRIESGEDETNESDI